MNNPASDLSPNSTNDSATEANQNNTAEAIDTDGHRTIITEIDHVALGDVKQRAPLDELELLKNTLETDRKKLLEISFISDQRKEDQEALQIELHKLREQLVQLNSEAKQFNLLSDQYNNQKSELVRVLTQNAALSDQNKKLTNELVGHQDIFEKHKLENKQLLEDYESLKAERDKLLFEQEKSIAADKELERLRAQYHIINRQHDELVIEFQSIKSENEKLTTQILALQQQSLIEKVAVEEAKSREHELQRELKQLRSEHTRIVEQMSQANANYVNELKSLYAHQLHEIEQEFQAFIHRRLENRGASQEMANHLVEYRNKILHSYVERPAAASGLEASSINQKSEVKSKSPG